MFPATAVLRSFLLEAIHGWYERYGRRAKSLGVYIKS